MEPLDIRSGTTDGKAESVHLAPYSEGWAKVVWPLTRFLFGLLAAVLLVPFLFAILGDKDTRDAAFDWSKTILAPVVGFASAAVGYYYGTRSSTTANDDT